MGLVCHIILIDQVIKGSCDFKGESPWWLVSIQPGLVVIDIVVVEINGFNLSCDLARTRDQKVMWLYGLEPLMAIHQPTKFGGHGHFRDIVLVCHMILPDHPSR